MVDFDHIFRSHYQQLKLYCLKFVSSEEDANDVLQEVFASIWEKQKFDLGGEHLKAYLFNAVRNKSLNFVKHQTVVRKHVDKEQQAIGEMEQAYYESGEKSLIEKEELEKIHAAINSLSGNYKEVIQLSRIEGLKNKEISQKLGVPIRTVETRLFRALANLRKSLAENQIMLLYRYFLSWALK